MFKKYKKTNGITLVALVVTIIVLLILAAVSINLVLGENGIITRAKTAKEDTRGGDVKEKVELAILENSMSKEVGGNRKNKEDIIQELLESGKLTEQEAETLRDNNVITIGSIEIDFTELKETLGVVYTDDMIGQKITYSSNGQNNWIVFGKDLDGNILITTRLPIDNQFVLLGGIEHWLSYEEDLHNICGAYSGNVQGKVVNSRSIKMQDILYVLGVEEPSFDTYKFGSVKDVANKKVDYFYPSLDAADNGYWQSPVTVPTEFKSNMYSIYKNAGTYYLWKGDENNTTVAIDSSIIRTDKARYIFNTDDEDVYCSLYAVATRCSAINWAREGDTDFDKVLFGIAAVGNGGVGTGATCLCGANSTAGLSDTTINITGAVRPIVVLPEDLLVEKQEDGTYDLVQ